MSDININGIPNMGFQGGGGGYFYDPYANLMQNQAAIQNNNQAVSNASAAVGSNANTFDPFAQSGGFGTMTDYYSSLGAAYGRATGGFGGAPGRVGTIGNPGTSNPGYLSSAQYDPFTAGAAPIQHYGGRNNSQVFDTGRYLQQNPDVWKAGALPWEHYNQFGQHEGRQGTWSDIFNSTSYAQKNPDVASSGMDPTAHWYQFGAKEGRQGAQTFDTNRYLSENQDVWKAGADPWQHWNLFGEKEGRKGSWTDAFNPETYRQQNPDVAAAGVDPTAHWFEYGQKEGRKGDWGGNALSPLGAYQGTGFDAFDPTIYGGSHPTAGFGQQPTAGTEQSWQDIWNTRGPFNRSSDAGDGRADLAASYYAANKDVYDAARASGQDPTQFALNHIRAYGDDEDRQFADFGRYGRENQDVLAAGMDPTAHWFRFGSKEGRAAPTSEFNFADYLAQNPDVLGSGMDPMAHWLEFGAKEKRAGALGNLSNTLVDQRRGFAEQARKDPNLMFKLVAKAMQEDQNSSEGRTGVIEAMLNRLNATGQSPLNPGYYPKNKEVYNSLIEAKLRNDPALYASVLADVERAFGGSNVANYATNWSSGDTWADDKQYVNHAREIGGNQFYIKNLNTPAGKAWAGPGTVRDNQRWLDRVMGNTATGN